MSARVFHRVLHRAGDGARDIASRTIARWGSTRRHAAHHDVAIGDHADQPLALEHRQAADLLIAHDAPPSPPMHPAPTVATFRFITSLTSTVLSSNFPVDLRTGGA